MSLLKNVVVAGLVGVVLLVGVARVTEAAQTAKSRAARADDGALQSQIAADLKKSRLAPRDIGVDVNEGVVTLTGKVRTATEKARAGRLAKVSGVNRVDNRIEIDPKIDQSRIDAAGAKTKAGVTTAIDATADAAKKTQGAVQKGVGKAERGVGKAADKTSEAVGKAGDKLGDTAVSTRVEAGLGGENLLQNTAIDVETTNRVVTLRGTVASEAAKAKAEEIARSTEGVTRVVNQLIVRKM
jgi:hyperosmotically inducible periplasmic protein